MITKTVVLIFASAALLFVPGTDAESLGSILKLVGSSIFNGVKQVGQEAIELPENKNSSIRYLLYTGRDSKKACYLEPTPEALQDCVVDPSNPTIFLIHGFFVKLNPGNLYEVMKDTILERNSCNVIIVDWTKYDNFPYTLAVANVFAVGAKIADLIEILKKSIGVQPEDIYLIGHSLGAHIAGVTGKHTPNIGKISGLDPAGLFFEVPPLLKGLSSSDANFVEVLHTSDVTHGRGIHEPVGDIDMYANGGKTQPFCQFGARYRFQNGEYLTVKPFGILESKRICHHELALHYFTQSINTTDCTFRGTMCDSYSDFKKGKCPPESFTTAVMGFYSQKVPSVPPRSKFYFRTRSEFPLCLKDGFEPKSNRTS